MSAQAASRKWTIATQYDDKNHVGKLEIEFGHAGKRMRSHVTFWHPQQPAVIVEALRELARLVEAQISPKSKTG